MDLFSHDTKNAEEGVSPSQNNASSSLHWPPPHNTENGGQKAEPFAGGTTAVQGTANDNTPPPAQAQKTAEGAAASACKAHACCPLLAAGFGQPQKAWRQRHPFLFWAAMLVLVFLGVGVIRYAKDAASLSGPKLGLVNVEGIIMDSKPVVSWLAKLSQDDSVRGILVHINSPGGAVGPSQEIYHAIKRAAQGKPVVVSMGGMAASGGYYAALGGDEIFASPSTLTGSIGVIMNVPNFEKLLATVGVSSKTLATGALKGAGDSTRSMTPEEEAYFQALLADMFDEFVDTIATNRHLSHEQVRAVADGRAMTGRQALKAGLVDKLGDMTDAQLSLQAKCGLATQGRPTLLEGPEKPRRWMTELMESVLHAGIKAHEAASYPQFMYR